jgi:hypothetical protein
MSLNEDAYVIKAKTTFINAIKSILIKIYHLYVLCFLEIYLLWAG